MFTHLVGEIDATPQKALLELKEKLPTIRKKLREENFTLTKEAISSSVTPDQHLIQAVGAVESIDKAANTLTRKLRDWYALRKPSLVRENTDNKVFVDATLDTIDTAPEPMGGSASEDDLDTMRSQTVVLHALFAQRDSLVEYLDRKMEQIAPNVQAVAGTMIGAKLLAIAGGLERLGGMPSGTIQVLGAETALFRHLRNRSARPPKHGIIFNHPALQRAPRQKRGKVARRLADTIAIAARIDRFGGEYMGEKLRQRVDLLASK